MSTLKTNNIEHLDASTPSIQTTIGGGTILAGVSTVSGALNVGSGTSISSPATNTLALGTNDVERLRITSTGLVGIGTDNPDEELTVVGSIKAVGSSDPNIRVSSTNTAYNGSMRLNTTNNTLEFFTRYAGTYYTNNLVLKQGNVGVGTDNPTKALQISQNSDCAIRIDANNSNANARTWEIIVGGNPSNNAEMVFRTRQDDGTGGSECVRFTRSGVIKLPDGGGVDFSATGDASGMTSELLDDYEEGTWTPNITSSGYTLSTTSGYYTKIGNLVSVHFQVKFSAIGSNNASAAFNGLPFNSSSAFHHAGVCRESTAYGDIFVAQVTAGNANVAINSMDGVVNGDNAIFVTARNYNAQITYFV